MVDSNTVTVSRTASWLSAARAAIVFIVLCGGLYPLVITSLGGALFPYQATGSLIKVDGKVVGSELVGQKFIAPEYFHGRPSAADYDPFSVGGSNLAASNPELRDRVVADSARFAALNTVDPTAVPVDMLAASGSGIDPHISPESAHMQAERVASARNLSVDDVRALISLHTEAPVFGVLGQPRVNVLLINLALDAKELHH